MPFPILVYQVIHLRKSFIYFLSFSILNHSICNLINQFNHINSIYYPASMHNTFHSDFTIDISYKLFLMKYILHYIIDILFSYIDRIHYSILHLKDKNHKFGLSGPKNSLFYMFHKFHLHLAASIHPLGLFQKEFSIHNILNHLIYLCFKAKMDKHRI